MNSQETLERLGTISLGSDFVERFVAIGDLVEDENGRLMIDRTSGQGTLQLGIWLNLVPEPFRPGVEAFIYEKAFPALKYETVSPQIIEVFVSLLQQEMAADMARGRLDRHGWRAI